MAVKLITNYSKRLGLPGYSSHQFSVSVETELVTTDDVAGESQRLYELLQTSVDEQIRQTRPRVLGHGSHCRTRTLSMNQTARTVANTRKLTNW